MISESNYVTRLPRGKKEQLDNQAWIIIAPLTFLMLITASKWGVVETSEARYAEISRELLKSGDWLHPTLLNIYHYHKPPVTYWLTALAYATLGVSSFSARFFLLIAYCAQLVLVYRLAQQLFTDKKVPLYAMMVYATTPLVLISMRALTTDAYLTTFVLLAIYAWTRFSESGRPGWLYLLSFAMGVAFLTKGPVSFVVPGLVIVGSWRSRGRAKWSHIIAAIALFIVIAFSWFVYLTYENPEMADYFFFHHFLDRIGRAEVFSRKEPWYYYLLVGPAVLLPWIIFFLAGLVKSKSAQTQDAHRAKQLAGWWFLLPLILFSAFSSKLVLYILPLSAGFSLLCGYALATGIRKPWLNAFSGLILLIYGGLIAMPLFGTQFTFDWFLIALPPTVLLLSLGILRWYEKQVVAVWMSSLLAATLILYSSHFFQINSTEVNSVSSIASFIKTDNLRQRNIFVFNELLPSLAFELDKDIISVYAGNHHLKREVQFQKEGSWRNFLLDTTNPNDVAQLKSTLSDKSVVVVKGNLMDKAKSYMVGRWRTRAFGKWIVLYN